MSLPDNRKANGLSPDDWRALGISEEAGAAIEAQIAGAPASALVMVDAGVPMALANIIADQIGRAQFGGPYFAGKSGNAFELSNGLGIDAAIADKIAAAINGIGTNGG